MRRLVCVGVNHRRAPVELRERVAFSSEQLIEALTQLKAAPFCDETIVLGTCNRVEIYAAGSPDTTPYHLSSFLHTFHGLDEGVLDAHLFRLVGEDAVSHLFRVAASLDAIVVGEPQILGQVKDAYFRAAGVGTTGPVLNRAFHRAFSVAKRVRSETDIASSAVSVSYAGVELARKIFGDLGGLDCLLVGAGDMGELAARHFVERGARLVVTNRSFDRAIRLAETYEGIAREYVELPQLLEEVDIVLSSTSAPGFIIDKAMVKKAAKARRYRPLFLVDIAVPRDIDPSVADIEGVFAYDVADLAQVVEQNLEQRRGEAERAEDIVRMEVLKFSKRQRELRAVPTIKALREHFLGVAEAEAARTLQKLGPEVTDKQRQRIEAMASSIVNKVLHGPVTHLKSIATRGGEAGNELLVAVQELFALQIEEASAAADTERVMAEARAAEDAFNQQELEQRLAAHSG